MERYSLLGDGKTDPALHQADAAVAVSERDIQPAVGIKRGARAIGKPERADFAALRNQGFGGARGGGADGLAGKGGASSPDCYNMHRHCRSGGAPAQPAQLGSASWRERVGKDGSMR